jgi:glucose dehydrogenase
VTLGLTPEVAHAEVGGAAASSMSNEWPSYGRNDAQERYTPLSSINPGTIGRLGLKWALELPNETNLVSTPLMVKGKLFFTGKFSVVYAVDARNGKIKWTFDPKAREDVQLGHESRRSLLERHYHRCDGGRQVDLSFCKDGRTVVVGANARPGNPLPVHNRRTAGLS